jgi:hypothetical protein
MRRGKRESERYWKGIERVEREEREERLSNSDAN